MWLAIPEHGGRASAVARMKVAARVRKVRGVLLLLPKPAGVPRNEFDADKHMSLGRPEPDGEADVEGK